MQLAWSCDQKDRVAYAVRIATKHIGQVKGELLSFTSVYSHLSCKE
jgi:hypothetical protein